MTFPAWTAAPEHADCKFIGAVQVLHSQSCSWQQTAPSKSVGHSNMSMVQDVTTFLAWAAEPEHDERKLMGAKWIFILSVVLLTAGYYKRWKWAPLKSRKVIVDAIN